MTDGAPGAAAEYSKGGTGFRLPSLPLPGVYGLRAAFAAVGVAGVVLLVVSTFTTVSEIKVLTTSDILGGQTHFDGGDLHGPALLLLGLVGLALLAGAILRSARPAMAALAVVGLVCVVVVATVDGPKLDDTRDIGAAYEGVSAGASSGFYLESAGAVALLLAAGGLFALTAVPVRPAGDGAGRQRAVAALRSGSARLRAGAARGVAAARDRRKPSPDPAPEAAEPAPEKTGTGSEEWFAE